MTQKLILVVYFGLLIAFSNGTNTFYAKFDKTTPKPKPTNFVIPRMNTGHPFNFPKLFSKDPPEKALCPAKLPIFCFNHDSKSFLCVEHDKAVFNGLNKDDDRQTVTFSHKDGYTALFNDNEELLCRLAPNNTNLTIEDFKAVNNIGILGQLERKMIEKLEDIEGDPIAVCEVSNSEQVRYFRYDENDNAYKYMVKLTTKKFHINGTLYSLSCYQSTIDRTAKQVLEQSVKDRLKLDEKVKQWYENYRNTWKFWFVIISLIVILLGVIGLCVCYCCGNHRVEQEEGAVELVGNDVSDSSLSKSDFVIELSDLESMQISLTNSTGEYSAETINSIISITDSTKSHSTDDLSFSSEVELTEKLQDSEDSHHSQSEIKAHETEDLDHSQSKTKVQESKDTLFSQSKTNAQKQSEEKYHSNSESDFSI